MNGLSQTIVDIHRLEAVRVRIGYEVFRERTRRRAGFELLDDPMYKT